jgi:ATP-binding cassette, subfamily B, bacterial MsbA
MSEQRRDKISKHRHFWRACRYLWPYRNKMVVSVAAALFVGLAMTGGLTAMLPIMQVLIKGDTVQGWLYRQVSQSRLQVKLLADPSIVQIVQVSEGPAKIAGLKVGQVIDDVQPPTNAPPSPFPTIKVDPRHPDPTIQAYTAGDVLRRIAWADETNVSMSVGGKPVAVTLKPLTPWYHIGLGAVQRLPIKPVQAVAVVFGFMASLSIIGQVMRYFQEHLSDKAAILAVNDIRRRLYDRVLRIPISYLGHHGASDATSRLVSDTDGLQDGFKIILGQSIQEPIKAAMAFGWAMYLSWKLTLFIILFAPLMAVMMKKFGKKMRRASRAALRSSSVMLGQIEATLSGVRVVKAFNAQRFERQRYTRIMNSLVGEQLMMSRIDAFSSPVMETLIMIMAGFVVLFAAYMILVVRTLDSTNFFMVMISLAIIAESLRKASKVNNMLQKSNAAAARIFELLDLPDEAVVSRRIQSELGDGSAAPQKLAPLRSRILFENVGFSYPQATTPALCGVSLSVPKGQSIAIVGRNGSGKTTLMALLERFYEPDSGRITIDGVDIRNVTLNSLREQITYVTQDTVIFPGTIAENIAYGEPLASVEAPPSPQRDAVRQRIEEAARRAFAHDFIVEKPGGYDMVLGGLGGQLSGGQKQRLCIARAIFHRSPILVLDEATSQVDAESEHLIQEAIEHLMHERTTFVIAHRFSTILSADTIVVMDRGRIVGQGKHDELLANCETYQQLYERQLVTAGK